MSETDKIETWMQTLQDYVGDCIALQDHGDLEDANDGYDLYDDIADVIEYLNNNTLKITLFRNDALIDWLIIKGRHVPRAEPESVEYFLKDNETETSRVVEKDTHLWQYAADLWERTMPD